MIEADYTEDQREIGIKYFKSEMRSLVNLLGEGRRFPEEKSRSCSFWEMGDPHTPGRAGPAHGHPHRHPRPEPWQASSPGWAPPSPWHVESVACASREAECIETDFHPLPETYAFMFLPVCRTHPPPRARCTHTQACTLTHMYTCLMEGAHTKTRLNSIRNFQKMSKIGWYLPLAWEEWRRRAKREGPLGVWQAALHVNSTRDVLGGCGRMN